MGSVYFDYKLCIFITSSMTFNQSQLYFSESGFAPDRSLIIVFLQMRNYVDVVRHVSNFESLF